MCSASESSEEASYLPVVTIAGRTRKLFHLFFPQNARPFNSRLPGNYVHCSVAIVFSSFSCPYIYHDGSNII